VLSKWNESDGGGDGRWVGLMADDSLFCSVLFFGGALLVIMTDSRRLLAEYVATESENAFREMVERYINLVYSTARRLVGGGAHLAKDVSQIVFTDLARKARGLSDEVMLGGWLHQRTFHVATTLIRTEHRRQDRERRASEMNSAQNPSENSFAQIEPALDEAILQLNAEDRKVILLRFFEQQDFRAVGEALGSNEDAARMRVTRALEKLHSLLKHRGVTLSAAALGATLAAEAVTAAPAGLAVAISGLAVTAGATGTGTTLTLLKIVAMTKFKLGIIGAVIIAGVATPLVIQHQAKIQLREENESLRQQIGRLAQLQTDNERLSNLVAQAGSLQSLSDTEKSELLRLRGELSGLRRDSENLARLKASVGQGDVSLDGEMKSLQERIALLKQALEEDPSRKIPELQFLTPRDWLTVALKDSNDLGNRLGLSKSLESLRSAAKAQFAPTMAKALRDYTQANGGQLPTDISQLAPMFDPPVDDAILQRYRLLHTNNVNELPSSEMLVTEIAAVDPLIEDRISISLDRYNVKVIGKEITGRGRRGAGEFTPPVTVFFPGVPVISNR